jgi:ribosomal protein S18 acetylase RimI-like enzyme
LTIAEVAIVTWRKLWGCCGGTISPAKICSELNTSNLDRFGSGFGSLLLLFLFQRYSKDIASEKPMSINQPKISTADHKAIANQPCKPNPAIAKNTAQIRTATIADQKYIIAGLVLAFSNDPAVRWMYPDPYQYLTHFPLFVQAFGGKAFTQETTYCIDGYTGAALWFSPGIESDVELVVELIEQSVFESDRADVFAVFEQMGHYHLKEPHWYLPMIGVEPTQQGKGHGSALMQHVLAQCDRDRLPAYLEASKPANVPFYERHGFEALSTIQVGASPPIFPMVRYPQ